MQLLDDEDYPLLDWARDRDVVPLPSCSVCWGGGAGGDGSLCGCVVDGLRAALPVAFGDAEADGSCRWCDGEGETFEGEVCGCLLADVRRVQEAAELLG